MAGRVPAATPPLRGAERSEDPGGLIARFLGVGSNIKSSPRVLSAKRWSHYPKEADPGHILIGQWETPGRIFPKKMSVPLGFRFTSSSEGSKSAKKSQWTQTRVASPFVLVFQGGGGCLLKSSTPLKTIVFQSPSKWGGLPSTSTAPQKTWSFSCL